MRKILVTSALPYSNGPLHLGHILEHVQSDIWVRVQKLLMHHTLFVCGEDSHGTPVMLEAEKQGISPALMTEAIQAEHQKDLKDFLIR